MADSSDSEGFLRAIGEAVGGFIAGLPDAVSSFFGGVGAGARVQGMFDWIALVLGFARLASVAQGVRRGKIVGPAMRGLVAIALLGWAVS
jgi:hypothetical protein